MVVVFDVTSVMSLAHTAQWLEEAKDANRGSEPLIFLVGTKRDLLVSKLFQCYIKKNTLPYFYRIQITI